MSEIKISTAQLEDSLGEISTAVNRAFTPSEQSDLYRADEITVPRPSFALFNAMVHETMGDKITWWKGRPEVTPGNESILAAFSGLRGIARTRVQTKRGVKELTGPAIVLADGDKVAMLVAERIYDRISDMQHALLESEYVKDFVTVTAKHNAADVTNAAEIGAALMVASSVAGTNPHNKMHDLAGNAVQTFGANFSSAGRQDIQVGHDIRAVRSRVLPTNRIVFSAAHSDQLPAEANPLDVAVSANERAVGMTLAGTTSRGERPDLAANMLAMVGE